MSTICEESDISVIAMKNAHHLGVISRQSCQIMRCQSVVSLLEMFVDVANEMSISGCIVIEFNGEKSSAQFGRGVSKMVCKYFTCEECSYQWSKKIQKHEKCITFSDKHITMVLETSHFTSEEEGLLQDNLAILIDTIELWIETQEKQAQSIIHLENNKKKAIQEMEKVLETMVRFNLHLVNRHREISENLMCNLASKFPSLGLDADQENYIIDIVNDSNSRHQGLVDQQVSEGEELKKILMKTMTFLMQREVNLIPTDMDLPHAQTVELF